MYFFVYRLLSRLFILLFLVSPFLFLFILIIICTSKFHHFCFPLLPFLSPLCFLSILSFLFYFQILGPDLSPFLPSISLSFVSFTFCFSSLTSLTLSTFSPPPLIGCCLPWWAGPAGVIRFLWHQRPRQCSVSRCLATARAASDVCLVQRHYPHTGAD